MHRWCSLHASIGRKMTKYTASCSTANKHAWKNWHHVPLCPHSFCDRSPQRSTSNCRTHGRWSYLARPWHAVYHTWWHDIGCIGFLNGMVTGQFHSTQHWSTHPTPHRLIIASASSWMANHPWKGCGHLSGHENHLNFDGHQPYLWNSWSSHALSA